MSEGTVVTWETVKNAALGLGLPGIEEATSWGQPCLKAHGKLWVWWSPSEDAPVFKLPKEERAILIENDPRTFFVTDHYRNHDLVLMRKDRFDREWALHVLRRTWRQQAPKRLLKAWDTEHAGKDAPSA